MQKDFPINMVALQKHPLRTHRAQDLAFKEPINICSQWVSNLPMLTDQQRPKETVYTKKVLFGKSEGV